MVDDHDRRQKHRHGGSNRGYARYLKIAKGSGPTRSSARATTAARSTPAARSGRSSATTGTSRRSRGRRASTPARASPTPADELHDFFSDLFGSGGAGEARRQTFRMRARGADVSYTLPVDFIEAAKGARKRVVVDGRTIDVTIPAGVRDRQMLRLKGQGGPGYDGGPPGDAYVEVHVQPHPLFERKDMNVHVELPVSLAEAVLGGRIEVPTVDGPVTMTVPRGANTGTTLRLRGEGIRDPKSGQRGDQYVRLKVVLPKEPDPELEAFLEEWAKHHAYDPRKDLEARTVRTLHEVVTLVGRLERVELETWVERAGCSRARSSRSPPSPSSTSPGCA
jgi:DnaJ-class molecular chaperone